MSHELMVRNRQRRLRLNSPRIKAFTKDLLRDQLKLSDVALGIHFVDAKRIAALNEAYLGHEGPTDIITFDHAPHSPDGPRLYGELFICPEVALEQAQLYGTSWHEELARYIIHGILHLLGFDDQAPDQRTPMKQEEERLLRKMAAYFPLPELEKKVQPFPSHG